MAITEIQAGHFSGGRAITHDPSGEDTRSLEDLILELQQAVNAGAGSQETSRQAVAATAEEIAFIAPGDGELTSVQAVAGTAAAAGEDMACDVKVNGVSALSAAITLDDAAGTDVQSGTIATAAFSAGDKVTVARTYTAGGSPTPMTDTAVTVGFKIEG